MTGSGALAKDDTQAAAWFRKAADQGQANAQNALGVFYSQGRGGLPKSPSQASALYRKAVDQGFAPAQVNLGSLLVEGLGGVAKDEVQAAKLYRQAANQGLSEGQHNLALLYKGGRGGLPRDRDAALSLFRKAAEQGLAVSQVEVGAFYSAGLGGLQKDDAQAAAWYGKAAAQGSEDGQKLLDELMARNPQLAGRPIAIPQAAARPTPPVATVAQAAGGSRIALLIGNSAYGDDLGRLVNPANDATLIAASLRKAGFDVEVLLDGDQKAMKRAIARLGQRLTAGGPEATGLFLLRRTWRPGGRGELPRPRAGGARQ
jgi:hypothetical protein